jgi:hypothetical protein
MNLGTPTQHLQRMVRGPVCANPECRAKSWRWRGNPGLKVNDQWLCSDTCAENGLTSALATVSSRRSDARWSVHRLPLGLLLLSRGTIDESQLRVALLRQGKERERKIGKCLEDIGAVTETELVRALGAQNCLPVLSSARGVPEVEVPTDLLARSECMAFRGSYQSAVIYVGFPVASDPSLLAALEYVLNVHCEPCLMSERTIREHLAQLQQRKSPYELTFDSVISHREIAGTIRSYCDQVSANRVRLAASTNFYWARLEGNHRFDLLFRNHRPEA